MSGQDLPGAWFSTEQDGAGRSRTEQDGAGRSRTEQDGAGRSRTEQDGAGRSRTEQDGAGRSRTEQDGAANGLRWAVSSIFILGLSDSRSDHYTRCPATVKHAERRSAILGDQVVVAVGCTGCVTANRWGCWDVSSRITVPMRMHRTKHDDNQSIGVNRHIFICLYFIWWESSRAIGPARARLA